MSSLQSPPAELTRVFRDADRSVSEQIADALQVGIDYLDLSAGLVTRNVDGNWEVINAVGDRALVESIDHTLLTRSHYHVAVSGPEFGGRCATSPAEITNTRDDTVIFQSYIGAPISIAGETRGTVCFIDMEPREEPFGEAEQLFVNLLSNQLEKHAELERHQNRLANQAQQLRAEKRRFKGITEASSDIIFRHNASGELTYVSAAVERLLGYEPAALDGRPFIELVAPDATEDALDLYRQIMAGDTVEGAELRLVTAEDEVRLFEINATPLTADRWEEPRVQGTARDITTKRLRQRDLELKTRAMGAANVGVVITDVTQEENPAIYANDKFCDLTGYDLERVLGSNTAFLHGDATSSEAMATLQDAVAAGESASVEVRSYRRSGRSFWNAIRMTPVESTSGEIIRYIEFHRDITERKREQRLLDVMNRVLRHNLRNQMAIMIGASSEAESPNGSLDTLRTAADDLLSIADRARDLYQYAQMDREVTRIEPRALLEDVRRDAVLSTGATVQKTIETDRDIAAGAAIRHAVEELLHNAIEHDPADDTTISVQVTDAGDDLQLTVTDNGPGINEMDAAAVTSGEVSPLAHGSGLGLWVVNWIVTRYGGRFQITPRTDGSSTGTRATLELPAVGPDQELTEATRPPTTLIE